jgi:hypothetical protein
MAKGRMGFNSFVSKLLAEEDADVLREGVRVLAQALMDAEVPTRSERSSTNERTAASLSATVTAP